MTFFDFLRPRTPVSIEKKKSATRSLMAYHSPGAAVWTPRDYASLARNGYERNVIAYRCIR